VPDSPFYLLSALKMVYYSASPSIEAKDDHMRLCKQTCVDGRTKEALAQSPRYPYAPPTVEGFES
jgi:hypothetical protein